MAFVRDGDKITISADLPTEEFERVLVAMGFTARIIFAHLGNRAGWQWVELMNQLFTGSPTYAPYQVPVDRTHDFVAHHIDADVFGFKGALTCGMAAPLARAETQFCSSHDNATAGRDVYQKIVLPPELTARVEAGAVVTWEYLPAVHDGGGRWHRDIACLLDGKEAGSVRVAWNQGVEKR